MPQQRDTTRTHFVRLAGVIFAIAALVPGFAVAQSNDTFRDARLKMVADYIEREGVQNPRVLDAMRATPRHEFVLTPYRARAYDDAALPIGHSQTISPPFIVAYMTETIDPQPTDKVLEIGTGSGYQAAVLSPLAAEVYSIEIVKPLGDAAAERLARLGYKNVKTKVGDGYQGWAEHAPFDKIIVTCSPENVPKPLVDQLREGGRMIIPLGERYQQVFHLFEKRDGKLVASRLIPTLFVPMTGISESQRKVLPDPLKPTLLNSSFEDDENKDGLADHWHYQRMTELVTDSVRDGKRAILFDSREAGRIAQALQGMAIDGRAIGSLVISLQYRLENARAGSEPWAKPALVVHFYDEQRRIVGDHGLGPWLGSNEWSEFTESIPVPLKAREMIVRVGLNGATGRLWVDDVEMLARPRK